jgi:hypothetical protein
MQHRPVLAFLFLSLLATSAQADPPQERNGKHHGKDKPHASGWNDDRQNENGERKARDHFLEQDRVTVRDFYARNPSSLPPGLAKRGGELPPGLAKRGGKLPPGLSRGQVLMPEHQVNLQPLPKDLERLLPPPPHEVIRRIIGRDIVLIQEHNNKVLDILKDALP